MSAWFAMLLGAALKSTFVVGAAWLLAFALRRQSAAARHLVWTAAAAALIALPALSVSMPALRVRTGVLAPFVATVTFQTTSVATPSAAAAPDRELARQPRSSSRASWRPGTGFSIALLWTAGTALALAHMLMAWVVMWRIRRTARPLPDAALFHTGSSGPVTPYSLHSSADKIPTPFSRDIQMRLLVSNSSYCPPWARTFCRKP